MIKRGPQTRNPEADMRQARKGRFSPLGELIIDIGTIIVAAIAFAPEIAAAFEPLKPNHKPADEG